MMCIEMDNLMTASNDMLKGDGDEMPLLEIRIAPVGTATASFSSYIDRAINRIEEKNLNYQVTPTATVIEGELDELMEVAKNIHRDALQNGSDRVITNISIDDRADKPIALQQQVRAVHQPNEKEI